MVRTSPPWRRWSTPEPSTLAESSRTTVSSRRSRPSAIWWKASTITPTLITLAVGKGVSALTKTVWPVARSLAATPMVPRSVRTASSTRDCREAADRGAAASTTVARARSREHGRSTLMPRSMPEGQSSSPSTNHSSRSRSRKIR